MHISHASATKYFSYPVTLSKFTMYLLMDLIYNQNHQTGYDMQML